MSEAWTWEDEYPNMVHLILALDIFCVVISILGCVGSILTMLVISKWKNVSSGAAFMYSLALTDLLAVFYDGVLDLMLPLFGWNISGVNDVICVCCKFFSWITTVASYYITVLFSLDKMLAVLFPFKYKIYGKARACVISTVVAYLVLSVWSLQTVFVFRLHPINKECAPVNFDIVSLKFWTETRVRISDYITGVIPIGLVFLFTLITILKIRMLGKRNASGRDQSIGSRRDAEITRQMVVVGIVFATFCVGFSVVIRLKNQISGPSLRGKRDVALLSALQNIFLALTNSVNFLVYIIFGDKFRKDFLALMQGSPIFYTSRTTVQANGRNNPAGAASRVVVANSNAK